MDLWIIDFTGCLTKSLLQMSMLHVPTTLHDSLFKNTNVTKTMVHITINIITLRLMEIFASYASEILIMYTQPYVVMVGLAPLS